MNDPSLQNLFSKMFESKTISPNYKKPHIIHTIMLLGQDNYGIGRYRIRKEVNLGEGSMKTMLSRLRDENLIDVLPHKQQGHILTPLGKDFLGKILEFMSFPLHIENDVNKYVIGKTAYYSIIPALKLKSPLDLGILQRDEAIKIGADGASVLVYNGVQLNFPVPHEYPVDIEEIDQSRLKNGDLIIIGGGEFSSTAILGVIAASISVVDIT